MIISTDQNQAQECAGIVAQTLGSVFDLVRDWGEQIEHFAEAQTGVITRSDLDEVVGGLVLTELDRAGSLAAGAGFVAGRNVLDDPDFYLSWWLNRETTAEANLPNTGLRPPRATTTQRRENQSFADYSQLEWWQVPAETGRPHITGPYIDFLCTEEYALTLTVPVSGNDAMIGVAGVDIPVRELERSLLPHLRGISATATLINTAGRIIVSTDPHRPTGSVLRMPQLAELWTRAITSAAPVAGPSLIRCGDLNVGILVE